jgi:hypothetical protein
MEIPDSIKKSTDSTMDEFAKTVLVGAFSAAAAFGATLLVVKSYDSLKNIRTHSTTEIDQ